MKPLLNDPPIKDRTRDKALHELHEILPLADFVTLHVPLSEAPVQSGSLGGRDGHDVLVLAWGSAPNAYWGYVTLTRKAAAQD